MRTKTGLPSIRSVAAATLSVAVVVIAGVSVTLLFDLIFHFHPLFLGVAAGWSLRVDPATFTAVVAGLGVGGGIYVLYRQRARRSFD